MGDINYREFYTECKFYLLMEGDSNWDYYLMQHQQKKPSVVALAKPQSGSSDCGFGDIAYFRNFLRKYNIPFDLNGRLNQLRLEGACI
jgi:hypothetical protein